MATASAREGTKARLARSPPVLTTARVTENARILYARATAAMRASTAATRSANLNVLTEASAKTADACALQASETRTAQSKSALMTAPDMETAKTKPATASRAITPRTAR